jgi:transcriptional regulator with XRE-family HTH domain
VSLFDDVYVIKEGATMSMAGRMLREARARAGLTQRQLSAKAGIPQETIARIERGRVDPRVTTLDRLLDGCEYGLESMPRLGIGIDRIQIQERLSVSMARRLEVAMADDAHYVEWRPPLRRVADRRD